MGATIWRAACILLLLPLFATASSAPRDSTAGRPVSAVGRATSSAVALTAHDARASGAPRTTCPARPSFPCSLPLVGRALAVNERAGRAYIAEDQGTSVDVLDTRTGALLRTVYVAGTPDAFAVDAQAGRIYAAVGFPNLVAALDARTGTVLYRARPRGHPLALTLVPKSSLLMVGTEHESDTREPGTVEALDLRRGVIQQVVARAHAVFAAVAVDGRTGHVFAADAAHNAVDMVDARRGRLLRATPVEGPLAVAIAPCGAVFVGTDGGVSVLDARTGARLHALAHPGIVNDIAVDPARGRVLVANFEPLDFSLYAFDARTAALLHKTNLDPGNAGKAPVTLAVDGARGRVYVQLGSQHNKNLDPVGPASVAVVDAATGALRRSIDLGDTLTLAGGGGPFGIAVDARAHRLIVLSDARVNVLDTTHL